MVNGVPGPKARLITGVMRDYQKDPFGFATRCAKEYGDIVSARFLNVPCYFLFHPADIEKVLQGDFKKYVKSVTLQSPFMRRLVGNGLLTSEGDFWLRQRRLAQPSFHRDRINGYAAVMCDYAQEAASTWNDGDIRDIHDEMMGLTLRVVAKTLFDAEVTDTAREVGELLEILVAPFLKQATLKWILDNRLPTPANRRFNGAAARLDKILFKIIDERRATGKDHGDLLSTLLSAQDDDGGQMTDQQLRDEAMTLFLAGHETTALALTWAFYELARNPEIEARLQSEIDEVTGGAPVRPEHFPRLVYTEKITREVMRLYPPAFALGRQLAEDVEIQGYPIKAGSQLFMFQYVTHRDGRFFAEPERFNPDRWTEEFSRTMPRYAYFPFGGGARLCIGANFAIMESALILASISQRFKMELEPGQTIGFSPALTLRPSTGIRMILKNRASATASAGHH